MSDGVKRARILVLEDEPRWQSIIIGITDNEKVDCEIVDSIAKFKEKFAKGKYQGVVLDNVVRDGEAFGKADLAVWVRKEDPDVRMALNSTSRYFFNLAESVNAWNLCKDSIDFREFLREIKSP